MAEYEVTCIVPDGNDPDRRIDAIGGYRWNLKIDEAIQHIESGVNSFYTNQQGLFARVIVAVRSNGRKYLKTTADGQEPNNLLSLSHCRI